MFPVSDIEGLTLRFSVKEVEACMFCLYEMKLLVSCATYKSYSARKLLHSTFALETERESFDNSHYNVIQSFFIPESWETRAEGIKQNSLYSVKD